MRDRGRLRAAGFLAGSDRSVTHWACESHPTSRTAAHLTDEAPELGHPTASFQPKPDGVGDFKEGCEEGRRRGRIWGHCSGDAQRRAGNELRSPGEKSRPLLSLCVLPRTACWSVTVSPARQCDLGPVLGVATACPGQRSPGGSGYKRFRADPGPAYCYLGLPGSVRPHPPRPHS